MKSQQTHPIVRSAMVVAVALASFMPAAMAWTQTYDLVLEFRGVAGFVADRDRLCVLYPRLMDQLSLPPSWRLQPGDIAYHQLRIFSNLEPTSGGVPYSTGTDCNDQTQPVKVNVTEDRMGSHIELQLGSFESVTSGGLLLPSVDTLVGSHLSPKLRLYSEFMEPKVTSNRLGDLAARLCIAGIKRGQMKTAPMKDTHILASSILPIPDYVLWEGKVDVGDLNLIFTALSDASDRGKLTWKPSEDEMVYLIFEHTPPKISANLSCEGGSRDFLGNYLLLDDKLAPSSYPIPRKLLADGTIGQADNAQCSPAEYSYP